MHRPKKNMLQTVLKNQFTKTMAPSTAKATAKMLHSLAVQYQTTNPGYNQREMNRFLRILREVYGGEFTTSVITATDGRVTELIADLMSMLIELVADIPNISASLASFDWRTLFNIPPPPPPAPGQVVVHPPSDDDSGSESVRSALGE